MITINGMLQISDSELSLMRLIWQKGGTALYAEIMDTLEAQGLAWKKNTVLTFLSRLVEKGCLYTNKIGRRNEYTALVTEAEYHAAQTRFFLDKVYEGSVKDLFSTLLQQGFVSEEDRSELKKFWNGGGEHD